MKNKEKERFFTGKLIFQLLVLGMAWTQIYALGFIQYLLYDPFKNAMGATNTQLGVLMMIFGFGNVIGAPVGGWLADHFDYRKLFVASLVGNAILSIAFSMHMTYSFAVVVWIGLAITTLVLNYPSHIKIVRMLASEENQGKIFGFNESSVGLGSMIMSAITLAVFAKFTSDHAGMQAVCILIGVVSLVVALLCWIAIKDLKPVKIEKTEEKTEKKEKMNKGDFRKCLFSPATWILGFSIFSIYTCNVTMSYFTPYATEILGMTVAFSGTIAILRNSVLKLFGPPIGGALADKSGSVLRALIIINALGVLTMLAFIFMPVATPVALIIFLILFIALIVNMGKGIYYAVQSELAVPAKYAATTVGIAAALGFSPDIFLFPLAGHWLDNYGEQGYIYLFTFQAIVMVIGVLVSIYALKYKKKRVNPENAETDAENA